jgi:hypothetical protein
MADDAGKKGYSKAFARKELTLIRSKKPMAFAVGKFATAAPVVQVVRGSAAKAKGQLSLAKYAEGAAPTGVVLSKRIETVNYGRLQLETHGDSAALVVQCVKKPSNALTGYFKHYFRKQFHLPIPWTRVIYRNFVGEEDASDGIQEDDSADDLR